MTAGVPRRHAIVGGVVALGGVVVGFVYGRRSDASKQPAPPAYSSGPGSGGRLLAPLAKVPADGGLITSGTVLVRDGAGVRAFSAVCTHLGCEVNRVANGKIYCPCHGSVFDTTTGKPTQGPATRPLPAVPVTVRNGSVYSG